MEVNDLDYIRVNKLITTSIYKQIASSIADAIDSGLLKYNDKLPTEKEICDSFSISNTAVKMAYEKLIQEGKIKRVKGKGTFVTNRKVYRTDLHSYYEAVVDDGPNGKYHSEVLLLGRILKDYSVYRAMRLDVGEKCFYLMAVTKRGNNPVLLRKIYLPEKYFPDFRDKHINYDRVYEFIEKGYGYKVKHMHSTFSTINAKSDEALLLNIQKDDALYYVRTFIIDDKDRIIGYVCNYFPGEFTEFEVTVHAI